MSDTREYMISDERKAALDNEAAIANAKAILTAAGYRILGPDEVDPVTVEKAASCGDAWSKPSTLKLAAGEMTAQELRTAQAVARGISAAIRALGRKA